MNIVSYMKLEMYVRWNPNDLTSQQVMKLRRDFEDMEKSDGTVSDELLDFLLWIDDRPSRVDSFMDYAVPKIARFRDGKILEVGCGPRAILARRLIRKGFRMEAIDPKLELDLDTNSFRKEEMTLDYDIEPYSCLIALEPCEAAEILVRLCVQNSKPFILAPCGAPHRLLDGTMPKDAYSWWAYLKKLDAGIKFSPIVLAEYVIPVLRFGL